MLKIDSKREESLKLSQTREKTLNSTKNDTKYPKFAKMLHLQQKRFEFWTNGANWNQRIQREQPDSHSSVKKEGSVYHSSP